MWSLFFRKNIKKRKSVFRLRRRVRIACEPIPWSAQGDPKIKEKTWLISEPTFLIKKCKNMRERGLKRSPKGWGDFGAGATGRTFGAPICFWTQKVYPKCSQNNLKGAKVTPKCSKSNPQGRKMHSYRSAKVVQVHQKMSAARYQARRTARTAFNMFHIVSLVWLQKLPQGCKSDTKILPKWPPRSQNGLLQQRQSGSSASKNVSCKIPGPADCAKRLQ